MIDSETVAAQGATEQSQALVALQAWQSGNEIDGGLAFADELRDVGLDYSLASLARIERFLDALREQQPPPEATFVAQTGQANLLRLIAWYAGELLGRIVGVPARWEDTARAAPTPAFRDGACCRIGTRDVPPFRPLMAVCARLFEGVGGVESSFREHHAQLFDGATLPAESTCVPPAPTPSWPADFPGARPQPTAQELVELRIEVPPWEPEAERALAPQFAHHGELLRSGCVVLGALIAPDNVIGAPHYRGGLFLQLAYDPAGRIDADTLERVAHRLYNEVLSCEEARRFIYSEHPRLGLKVPIEVSPYPLWMSGAYVPQEQLPDGLPSQVLLPLLVDPKHPEVVAVLPSQYWPADMHGAWLEASEARHGERLNAALLRQRGVDQLREPGGREVMQHTLDFQMGAMYFHGANMPQDYVLARERWESESRSGNPFAQVALGVIHQQGLGVPIDVPRARRCFSAAIARGLELGDFELGRSFLIEGNHPMARLHLLRAHNRGHAPAGELLRELDGSASRNAATSTGGQGSIIHAALGVACAVTGITLASAGHGWLGVALLFTGSVLLKNGFRRKRAD